MPIISVKNATKIYRAGRRGKLLLGRGGIPDLLRGVRVDYVHALQDINLDIEPGESVGIIGANGSGKSTLLKIIAGVTIPTSGTVEVFGRVASLLELGAGFHPMLTGRENIYLNAGLLGMRHAQVDAMFDEIAAFSGIGEFIDYPVDTYSSGMYVRIGFSVAAYANPDVFLVDEVLAVGDEEFQRRCRRRIGELREMGKTIVFVSHDLGIVNTLCKRVILLSKGRMILRDSPSKAIEFYLRQIGEEKGVHTLAAGSFEVIVCTGRLSVFYNQDEITAPSGFQFQIFNLGQWHRSDTAFWRITEASATHCVAEGSLPRLPVTLIWTMRVEENALTWHLAIDVQEEFQAETFEAVFFFPTRYTQWTYDDQAGEFQELLPEDTVWQAASGPELLCERAALLPASQSEWPAIVLETKNHRPHFRGSWMNADYMTGCRVFRAEEQLAEDKEVISPGRHDILELKISVHPGAHEIARKAGERSSQHIVESGALQARFDRGLIRLRYEDRPITSALHVYASLLIGNLWNDSTNIRWHTFERDGDHLRYEGTSRRFPYRQIWELEPTDDGVDLQIRLQTLETLEVQEYQTSILLPPAYTDWKTDHENGVYPAIEEKGHDWFHLNKDYTPGTFAEARGSGIPVVRLEAAADCPAVRMTALNTDYHLRSRVLQALRTPEHGFFRFEPGTHLYFSGRIRAWREG